MVYDQHYNGEAIWNESWTWFANLFGHLWTVITNAAPLIIIIGAFFIFSLRN